MGSNHVAIVWNPSKTSKDDLEAALADGVGDGELPAVSWFETSVDDPGRGQAREALDAGADLVIAAGGDGTVRAVAECLADADTEAALGVVPMGTGNLLARNLGLPLRSKGAAFEVALGGDTRTIDLGWADAEVESGRCRFAFTVMAGVGIDAHMITETDEDLKGKVGWLAYVESLGRAVSASDIIHMDLTVDGEEVQRREAHTLIVGNCGILTGGVTLLPDADPADGELDMLVLSAEDVGGWLDTLRSMVWDNGLKRMVGASDEAASSDSVEHRRATAVALDLEEPRVLELDGDEVGESDHVEFSLQPGALQVRVPRD
ncbi:diacylglycerol kinase family protein [Demequina sp. NBRC 110056]|uniref:diacylglycerol/lipid kinase family protein n=1 Tax=Demequina sp. NBRC 110056 TaxID=1570345 RepID=UPI000A06A459|nr:diacylglycerol kinase family protein [Demequina sp. NBRC 110056]